MQCGRVVVGDLHAFGLGGSDFPAGCLTAPKALSPQQRALEFLLFESATTEADEFGEC